MKDADCLNGRFFNSNCSFMLFAVEDSNTIPHVDNDGGFALATPTDIHEKTMRPYQHSLFLSSEMNKKKATLHLC